MSWLTAALFGLCVIASPLVSASGSLPVPSGESCSQLFSISTQAASTPPLPKFSLIGRLAIDDRDPDRSGTLLLNGIVNLTSGFVNQGQILSQGYRATQTINLASGAVVPIDNFGRYSNLSPSGDRWVVMKTSGNRTPLGGDQFRPFDVAIYQTTTGKLLRIISQEGRGHGQLGTLFSRNGRYGLFWNTRYQLVDLSDGRILLNLPQPDATFVMGFDVMVQGTRVNIAAARNDKLEIATYEIDPTKMPLPLRIESKAHARRTNFRVFAADHDGDFRISPVFQKDGTVLTLSMDGRFLVHTADGVLRSSTLVPEVAQALASSAHNNPTLKLYRDLLYFQSDRGTSLVIKLEPNGPRLLQKFPNGSVFVPSLGLVAYPVLSSTKTAEIRFANVETGQVVQTVDTFLRRDSLWDPRVMASPDGRMFIYEDTHYGPSSVLISAPRRPPPSSSVPPTTWDSSPPTPRDNGLIDPQTVSDYMRFNPEDPNAKWPDFPAPNLLGAP